jgi:hypothetical protein
MLCTERGAEYEFRLSAKNTVDYGEAATSTIRTPDGSESRDFSGQTTGEHVTDIVESPRNRPQLTRKLLTFTQNSYVYAQYVLELLMYMVAPF